MTCILLSGLGISPGRDRSEPPSPDQVARRRHDDWRRDHDELGRTQVLIAALYGVHPDSVRRGIRAARALRREVARAAD